ncbi:MAG: hypothetical protein ABSA75_07815 [Candidatus Bathyarchaeia archaeon]|jgi:hypothetical protein
MTSSRETYSACRQSNINATRAIASTLGVLTGISGISHGISEALQGNHETNGFVINAIGKGSSWTKWTNGGEGAFTLIPNFFITGTLTIITGIVLAVWSARFIQTKKGSPIFLLIGTILFLVGGGVAQVPFIILTWVVATRINKPLSWWNTKISMNTRGALAKAWLSSLIASSVMLLIALEIAIFGFLPGVNNLNQLLIIDWAILGLATIILLVSIVAGLVHDIEKQANQRQMNFAK